MITKCQIGSGADAEEQRKWLDKENIKKQGRDEEKRMQSK
jgi:hypothetical protein